MINLALLFSNFSHSIATVLIAMTPIGELRAAIPIAIEVYEIPVPSAIFLSIFGNMIPPTLILLLVPRLHQWLIKTKILGKVFTYFLERAEKKFKGNFEKWGLIGLTIFVGIPLPITGAWTGALAALVFNIPFKKSWPAIFAGVCLAAAVVTSITLFAGGALRWLIG